MRMNTKGSSLMLGLVLALSGQWACRGASSHSRGAGSGNGWSVFGRGLTPVAATKEIQRQEKVMFERLNRDRAQRGLQALQWDRELSLIARHHSADMRDNGFFEHESPASGTPEDRVDAASYLFSVVRENLAEGKNVELCQDLLLDSPHHYDNIVAEDITHLGIGIVPGGVVQADNLTITQLFASPRSVESPGRALVNLRLRLKAERKKAGRSLLASSPELETVARRQIENLDSTATANSLAPVSRTIAAGTRPEHSGSVQVLAVTVTLTEQVVFPERLLQCSQCTVAMATRRVREAKGRPLLQVLFIVLTP